MAHDGYVANKLAVTYSFQIWSVFGTQPARTVERFSIRPDRRACKTFAEPRAAEAAAPAPIARELDSLRSRSGELCRPGEKTKGQPRSRGNDRSATFVESRQDPLLK
jgi:hypothetical protein